MAANNSLEMKVDLSDFLIAESTLESQENKLMNILDRYASLKNRATEFMEDDDTHFEKMQQAVDAEITKVKAELKIVQTVHAQIKKIVDAMNSMDKSATNIIDKTKETIQQGVESIIDLTALGL